MEPTDDQHDHPPGLRERKKRATRRALQRAAMQLACDRGPDVTVEEICAEVDVSPRTFFNYFASKGEAIVGEPPRVPPDALLADFEAGGPTGHHVDDLLAAIGPHLRDNLPTLREMHLRRQVLEAHPELVAQVAAGFTAIEQRLALAAARRLGTDVRDLGAQLLAAIATSSMRLAVRRWVESDGDPPVESHLRDVLAHLPDLAGSLQPPPPART